MMKTSKQLVLSNLCITFLNRDSVWFKEHFMHWFALKIQIYMRKINPIHTEGHRYSRLFANIGLFISHSHMFDKPRLLMMSVAKFSNALIFRRFYTLLTHYCTFNNIALYENGMMNRERV